MAKFSREISSNRINNSIIYESGQEYEEYLEDRMVNYERLEFVANLFSSLQTIKYYSLTIFHICEYRILSNMIFNSTRFSNIFDLPSSN